MGGLPVRTDPLFWDAEAADVLVGDRSNLLIGGRPDIPFDFGNSAVITDANGAIVINMWQRAPFRCAR